MNIPFVDPKAQYASIQTEIDSAIAEVIKNTAFIGAPIPGKCILTSVGRLRR